MIFRFLTATFLLLSIVGCADEPEDDSEPPFVPIEPSVPMGQSAEGSLLVGT